MSIFLNLMNNIYHCWLIITKYPWILRHPGDLLADARAYQEVEEAVESIDLGMNTSSRVFAYAKLYNNPVSLSIVIMELTRNILLAMMCVFICALFLIGNVGASLIILCTVSITLVDVAGE